MKTTARRFLTFLLALAVLAPVGVAQAQLLYVTGKYRVVSVDHSDNRFAVALPDADPNERQNWVYIEDDTRMAVREYYPNGTFRDRIITSEGILDVLSRHVGEVVKVHGGRDWDGSIDAKALWM